MRRATPARGKVATRIVVLFVLCALLPVVCLALVASDQVTRELRTASRERLHQEAKSLGMEILDQLRGIESDLTLVAAIVAGEPASPMPFPEQLRPQLAERFRSLAVVLPDGTSQTLVGSNPPVIRPSSSALAHLRSGKSVLTVTSASDAPPRLVMARLVDSRDPGPMLVAEIDNAFIWKQENLPSQMAIHVLGPSLDLLFTSSTSAMPLDDDVRRAMTARSTGDTEWERDGETYSARYWSLPLAFDFLMPEWKIVASEAKTDMLAPIYSSRLTFILVTALTLWVVTLFSLSQVRQSMVPLMLLREGTRRLGDGDFAARVDVRSGDEFEELAGSFNTMAGQLKRQFDTLSAMAELERAVLSSLDIETIVRGALDRLPQLIGCDHLAVIVFGSERPGAARVFKAPHAGASADEITFARLPDAQALLKGERILEITTNEGIPEYLSSIVTPAWATCVVCPLVLGERLVGVLVVGDSRPAARSPEDLRHIQQIGVQVGIALSNANLVEALDRLNVGTIAALARTVDAKSPWTAGHSQRVMEIAVEIGRVMGLGHKELDGLARGALLHDIGKIAVPSSVLNKPGPLTAEEFAVMREHPEVGARILEPIPEYGHLIPIVLQHHEWFDGRGYPFGLASEAIDVRARIVAVADVVDSLTSERPYRDPMTLEQAVELIRALRGTQFDPRMVDAFLVMLYGASAVGGGERIPQAQELTTLGKGMLRD